MKKGRDDEKEEHTPLDVFRCNMAALRPGQRAVVLVTTGSLNPVHLVHVAQLERAAALVEQEEEGTRVVAAFLSPSDAAWSAYKEHGCMRNEHKVKLARLATAQHHLVRVSTWEVSRDQPVNYPAVISHILAVCQQATVLYVCGADHARKCRLFEQPWCVVVGRPGVAPPAERKARYVECEEEETDVSSTAVRRAAQEGRLDSVAHLLHPAVLKELQSMGKDAFY